MQLVIDGREITLNSTTKCSSSSDEASWLAATRHSFEVHTTFEAASTPSLKVMYSGADTGGKMVSLQIA